MSNKLRLQSTLMLVALALITTACGGGTADEASPAPLETETTVPPAPTPTAVPDYVHFRDVPLHPALTAVDNDLCPDIVFSVAWRRDPISAVMATTPLRDTQCFRAGEDQEEIKLFYLEAPASDGWAIRDAAIQSSERGWVVELTRSQGLEVAWVAMRFDEGRFVMIGVKTVD